MFMCCCVFSFQNLIDLFVACVLQCRFFFFFQAEDGIRDIGVTGVQTCALPISPEGAPPPGSLVTVPFQISCGECERCRRGHTGNCETVPRLSMYGLAPLGGDWGGFLSDTVRVPYAAHMLIPLPAGVDPAAAASVSDNVPDGWRAVAEPLERYPGGPVLICGGAPSITLYAVAAAIALGAERVDYADQD